MHIPYKRLWAAISLMVFVLYLAWEFELLDLSVFDYYRDVEELADPDSLNPS